MKNTFLIPLLFISLITFGQKSNYNLNKGFIAEGYDVVSYFISSKAVKGNKKYQTKHNKVKFAFSSKKNLTLFSQNPEKYTPQYGGWCAYALGTKVEKVEINPKTFEIRDGKLYLFYNSWGINTFEKWKIENPEKLRKQADKNWNQLKEK
jgi:YHS domain-containing protein